MQPLIFLKQVLTLCLYLVISWVLIHFFAVFGLFFAVAIPVLHLVFYPHIMCFWCRLRHSPHSLRHSLIDSLFIVFLTIFSLGVVYLESRVILALPSLSPQPTANFVIPTRNQYRQGEIFPLHIQISGIIAPINVIQADLAFDPTLLEIVDNNTQESFATIFLQNDYNNDLGYLRLTGGVPNPGYNQPTGLFGTVYFRGKKPGLAEVTFLESSQILANDGKGSNVTNKLPSGSYLITNASLSPEEIKLQENVLIKKQVLGDTAISNQYTFYTQGSDLPQPFANILGDSEMPLPAPNQPVTSSSFLNFLHRLDSGILNTWQKILFR